MAGKRLFAAVTVAGVLLVLVVLVAAGGLSPAHQEARSQRPEVSSDRGTLEGRVLDTDGQPLAGAEVTLERIGSSVSTILPVGTTDEQGNFKFPALPAGQYRVHASKESEGYPSTRLDLYATGTEAVPQVVVVGGQVASDVIVRLGPKASKIVGKVTDASTGTPLENASIVISRVGEPGSRLMTGPNKEDEKGSFELLLPPVPVMIEISAPGYEKKQINSLQLLRGETRQFDISLRRSK